MKTLTALMLTAFIATPAFAAKINGTVATKGIKDEDYAAHTKISLADAIGAALENSPGIATSAELDDENGFLVYEVEIRGVDKKTTKLLVDAGNKSVLHTEKK